MSDYVYTVMDAVTLYFKTLINPDYVDELAAKAARTPAGPRVFGLHSSSSGNTSGSSGGSASRGTAGGNGPRMGTIGGSSCQTSRCTVLQPDRCILSSLPAHLSSLSIVPSASLCISPPCWSCAFHVRLWRLRLTTVRETSAEHGWWSPRVAEEECCHVTRGCTVRRYRAEDVSHVTHKTGIDAPSSKPSTRSLPHVQRGSGVQPLQWWWCPPRVSGRRMPVMRHRT